MRFVMILNRRGAVILLHVLAVFVVVKSHVCLLKKRPDPSLGGTLRWSLLFEEICYCQGVVAPRFISQETCPIKDEACNDGNACNLWFVDDPTSLMQRQNWNKETLDILLERAVYCKETTKAITETITGEAELEGAIRTETEGAISSQKTDAVKTSTSADHDQEETTQAETDRASLSQKTGAIETSTSADQEETTQAETEGASSSQRTDAVGLETSTSAGQEEATQAKTEGANSSHKTDAKETGTSADQVETTQATTEGASQKTDAVKTGTSANQACESWPLGMADKSISDKNITASSYQKQLKFREPKYARLGGNYYWISDGFDTEPWIQVDLGSSHRVTRLQTEGNDGGIENEYWVEQLKVQVGMNGASLVFIEDITGQPKLFDANTDPDNIADVILDGSGILTRFIRIYPINCKRSGNNHGTCLMRFEILGCQEH